MKKRPFTIIIGLLLVVGAAALFALIARHPRKYQWDFQTYYYASLAFAQDRNPYDLNVLSETAQSPISLKFMYPPHALVILQWTTWLTYPQAHVAWLVVKGVFLLVLLSVWSALLEKERPGIIFFAFAAVAFNATIIADLTTGNITIVEQAFLWTGFLAFVRGRLMIFAVCVAAGSFFKVTNALFLGLLFFVPCRRSLTALTAGTLGTMIPLAVSYLQWPRLFQAFLQNANVIADPLERGAKNPCLSAFLLSAAEVVKDTTGWEVPPWAIVLLFVIHAVLALAITAAVIRRYLALQREDRYLVALSLACLVYPLIVPRFKNYAFIQIIPPAYLILRRLGTGRFEVALLAFVLTVPTFTLLGKLQPLMDYYLMFVSYGLWVWMLLIVREWLRGAVASV
jgi:Glycosyltransferase family 87